MSFSGWLDARDGKAVAREWATLDAKKSEIGQRDPHVWGIQPEGAALVAAAFLGCSPDRFKWFTAQPPYLDDEEDDDEEEGGEKVERDPLMKRPRPITSGGSVSRCFLDGALDFRQECSERWEIREVIEGTRGVQHITLSYAWGEETREGGNGGSATVVRVFDRSTSRAMSIPLWSNAVWTIGEPFDLTPLDLFAQRTEYKLPWNDYTIDAVRGFLAQLTADLDAHFDVSATWPGGVVEDRIFESQKYNFRVRRRVFRFEAGDYAFDLTEHLGDVDAKAETGMIWAVVHGLPWGQEVNVRITGTEPAGAVEGWVDLTLPRAQLEATIARLAAIPGIVIT